MKLLFFGTLFAFLYNQHAMAAACSQACDITPNSTQTGDCTMAAYANVSTRGKCVVIQPDGSYHYYDSEPDTKNDDVCYGLIDQDWTKAAVKKGFSYADKDFKKTHLDSPDDCKLGVFAELKRYFTKSNCNISSLTSKISTAYASNSCIKTPIILYTWTRP